MNQIYNVIIIGAGPAGISAGIYVKRSGKKALILYYGNSSLEKTKKIENYYGFINGIDGKTLYNNGIEQAKNLGIEVKKEEVLNIEKVKNNFVVETVNEKYIGQAVIVATGNKKLKPNIKGIERFEGKGISYCAICDGFFYKNKNVAVLGNGNFAINETNYLKNIANNVTILTNGLEMKNDKNVNIQNIEINTKKIKQINGEPKLQNIEFEDSSKLDIEGIFIAIGEAGGADFAKNMGIILKNDNIVVDENMETNVKGMYACGNVAGGLLQVNKAVYEGAKAGLSAIKRINNLEKNERK